MTLKTTKREIVDAHQLLLDSNILSVNSTQAMSHCWRCGLKKRLDRCHIKAQSQGGEDTAQNYVLLCKHCHFASPDNGDPEFMFQWLSAYKVTYSFYIDQGIREYEFIYNTSINEQLKRHERTHDQFMTELEQKIKEIPQHFGQPRHNASSIAGTIASIFRR